MTTPIPVDRIEGIRLTCKHCGVALIMPFDGTKEVPSKCFNCYHDFPYQSLMEFIREFRCMKGAIGKADVTFMVHLEHDEDEKRR